MLVWLLVNEPDDPEVRDLPDDVKMELYRYKPRSDSEACIWLTSDGCRHYAHRPSICRNFVVGSEACLRWRAHFQTKEPYCGQVAGEV